MPSSSPSWLLYFVSGIQSQMVSLFYLSFCPHIPSSSNYKFSSSHTSFITLFSLVPCHHTSLNPYDYPNSLLPGLHISVFFPLNGKYRKNVPDHSTEPITTMLRNLRWLPITYPLVWHVKFFPPALL